MRLTLGQLIEASSALARIMEEAHPKDLAVTLQLIGIRDAIEPHLKKYAEVRRRLIKQLGSPVKDSPKMYRVLPENQEEFDRQDNEMRALDVEVLIVPIQFGLLGTLGLDKPVTPNEVKSLFPLIDADSVPK